MGTIRSSSLYCQDTAVGVPDKTRPDTDPNQITEPLVGLPEPRSRSSPGRLHHRPISKRRSRRNRAESLRRILQSSLPSSEVLGGLETHHRSKTSQSVSPRRVLPDGMSSVRQISPTTRSVGFLDRSDGRVLPHPDPYQLKEVPPICTQRKVLPVQSATLRFKDSAVGIHESDGTITDYASHREYPHPPILRRLVDSNVQLHSRSQPGHQLGFSLHSSGTPSELSEIRPRTQTDIHIHRSPLRSNQTLSVPHRREHDKDPQASQPVSRIHTSAGQTMAEFNRPLTEPSEADQIWQATHPSAAMGLSQTVDRSQPAGIHTSTSDTGCQTDSDLVAKPFQHHAWGSYPPIGTYYNPPYGCFHPRLGWPQWRLDFPGSMGWPGAAPPYQPVGVTGHHPLPTVPASSQRLDNSHSYGQYNSGLPHQQTGRDQVLGSLPGNQCFVRPGDGESVDHISETHSRPAKCDSRPAVTPRSDRSDRMVLKAGNSRHVVPALGYSSSRPFRHQVQYQMHGVRQSSSRSPGVGHRRPLDELGDFERIRIPSRSTDPTDSIEITTDETVQADTDSTLLAKTILVQNARQSSGNGPNTSTSHARHATSTSERVEAQPPRPIQAPRLAANRRALRGQGFSEDLASRISATQAPSTLATYEGKWKIFAKFCAGKKIDPLESTVAQIGEFLSHQFDEGQEPATVEVYKTVIANSLKYHRGTNLGQDQTLCDLIAWMKRKRPKGCRTVPKWDLKTVLFALMEPPFEPIQVISLANLTWKTVFLVMLASGARRGEIHALDYRLFAHDPKWRFVTLVPHQEFIAKTQLRKQGNKALEPFVVRALAEFVGPDLPKDRLLCPVRCIKTYLARTQHLREGKKLFFISYSPRISADIHKNTISGWVRKLIQECYRCASSDVAELQGTSAHTIRGMAATLAFKGGVDLEDVLKACGWSNHSTFMDFYLKDLTMIQGELLKLGPLSVAQHVINTPTPRSGK